MIEAHTNGKAVAHKTHKELAELYQEQLNNEGLISALVAFWPTISKKLHWVPVFAVSGALVVSWFANAANLPVAESFQSLKAGIAAYAPFVIDTANPLLKASALGFSLVAVLGGVIDRLGGSAQGLINVWTKVVPPVVCVYFAFLVLGTDSFNGALQLLGEQGMIIEILVMGKAMAVEAYKTSAIVRDDGTVVIGNLPFQKGQRLEVILLEQPGVYEDNALYALRGEPFKYDGPFQSVAMDELENVD
ncbi:MAG: hypothetical protein Q9180_009180 [Flavoplaca navasiana]